MKGFSLHLLATIEIRKVKKKTPEDVRNPGIVILSTLIHDSWLWTAIEFNPWVCGFITYISYFLVPQTHGSKEIKHQIMISSSLMFFPGAWHSPVMIQSLGIFSSILIIGWCLSFWYNIIPADGWITWRMKWISAGLPFNGISFFLWIHMLSFFSMR